MQKHITVLKKEAIEALNLTSSAIVVDATLGSGGHTQSILNALGDQGTLIAIDADPEAISSLEGQLTGKANLHLIHRNFREINKVLEELGIEEADAILADLGWRMEQFDGGGKGFSFQVDEPLLMTFGNPEDYPFTAKDIVNEWDEDVIANILKGYGEERFAKRIARHIVEARATAKIETSGQFRDLILEAVPGFYKIGKVHPATRSFQAFRIAVNDELGALEAFLEKAQEHLKDRGRLVVITFHSIEDRIVKHTFRKWKEEGKGTVITKKPITASSEELHENPRARSAKLRIFEQIK